MAVPDRAQAASTVRSSGGGGGGGLAYHTATYWETRFECDPRETDGFEWLSSSTNLLTSLPRPLLLRQPPIRILHIGVGTSSLSLDLVRWWREHSPHDWKQRAQQVVNVDFSKKSIDFQRNAEQNFLRECRESNKQEVQELMEYHVLDLLNWSKVQVALGCDPTFGIVLDKSTTDSISTGSDVMRDSGQPRRGVWHPETLALATSRMAQAEGVATIQVLGIHLGALVNKGGLWLCHSYSRDRWEDVRVHASAEGQGQEEGDAWPWTQVAKTPVPVESSNPNAPQINHYIYTMQRN